MPVTDQNRRRWTYTDDMATDWAISAKSDYVSQGAPVSVGGAAAAATVPRVPRDLKPRKVKMTNAGGTEFRWLVAYEVTAPIWAGAGVSVNMNVLGVSTAMTSTLIHRAEKRRDTTQQQA